MEWRDNDDVDLRALIRVWMANRGVWESGWWLGPTVSVAHGAEDVDRYPSVGVGHRGDVTAKRQTAAERSSYVRAVAPVPSRLSDDECVVALDPAVPGDDEEVEPDTEHLAVIGDRLPVNLTTSPSRSASSRPGS